MSQLMEFGTLFLMNFTKRKTEILSNIAQNNDNSVKQSIDHHALPIVNLLNQMPNYVTTSSCSGRVSIISLASDQKQESKRKSGIWFYCSHDPILLTEDLNVILKPYKWTTLTNSTFSQSTMELIYFKFEPFVLHVEASDMESAKRLLNVALQSGYRNSGLVVSGTSRFMVAIRHTMKLDVPIGWYDRDVDQMCLSVSTEYLESLVHLSNEKFDLNFKRMQILIDFIQKEFFYPDDYDGKQVAAVVETKEECRIRKRMEGLRVQQAKLQQRKQL